MLMSIPGWISIASLLSSYIGKVKRFPDPDRLAVFFGIVPATRDFSSIRRRGHMSKEGSASARWALSMAVDTMLRNKAIGEYYASAKERKQSEKLTHVLTMRKLIRIIYKMPSERRLWKYDNSALIESKLKILDKE